MDQVIQILLPTLGTILTGFISWGLTALVKWLSTKTKNKEILGLVETITTVVNTAVKATYQSYVEGLKGTDAWTKEAQEAALKMALETAKQQLTMEALKYIEEQHGDIDDYLKSLVESILYDLKNGKTATNTNVTIEK